MAELTTIWLPVRPDHPLLAAAGFTEVAQVPVFIDGAEFREFTKSRRVDVTPKALLFGALLHAAEDVQGVDPEPFRKRLPQMLEACARGFRVFGVESLITNAAAVLRKDHGSAFSRKALGNMINLFPTFHRARSDLIADLWVDALHAEDAERREALAALLSAFAQLERERLAKGPRAVVCYAAVAATAAMHGFSSGRELFMELGPEIDVGDEGELRERLEAFLTAESMNWSALDVKLND